MQKTRVFKIQTHWVLLGFLCFFWLNSGFVKRPNATGSGISMGL